MRQRRLVPEPHARWSRSPYHRAGWSHPSIADPIGIIAARLRPTIVRTTLFLEARPEIVERINGEATPAGFVAGYRRASR